MDEAAEQRILDMATYVHEAVTVLASKRDSLSFEQYRDDRETRDVVEREFETAIEAWIDIGRVLLRTEGCPVPEENAEVFHELGDRGLLDSTTARRMAEAARFRNVLSHRYGDAVNDRDVFTFLQHELPLFRTSLQHVRTTID